MYKAKIQNSLGEVLQLNDIENRWAVLDISGLSPAPAIINHSAIAGMDGDVFNSSRIDYKNIVILLRICGEVEENRMELYRYFRTKEKCRFFYETESRDVFIDGYIETVDCGLYTRDEVFQISIVCMRPFFSGRELKNMILGGAEALFTFPFSIERGTVNRIPFSEIDPRSGTEIEVEGDADTGMIIRIRVLDDVSNIVINNATIGKRITLDDFNFIPDDVIVINTVSGEKDVYLLRDGSEERLIGFLTADSSLFQLRPGINRIEFAADGTVDSNKVEVSLEYRDLYKGV